MPEYLGINIDYSRDKLFDEVGLKRLRDSYMTPEEKSPQERFAFVSKAFSSNNEHAQRLYNYSSKHWLSYSTPVLSYGRSAKGMPISCFLVWVEDSAEGLVNSLSETNWLSMLGGGVGIGMGIRSAGEKSTGVLPHLKIYDASSLAYRQGTTRRGSTAVYLPINHPDIEMFLEMRKPSGDPNMRAMNLHHGINITDDFMQIIENCMINPDADDKFELKDPNTSVVKKVVSAKELWQRIIELRTHTGEPYLHFIDTSNNALPYFLKEKGLRVRQSNLCSEIILPTDKDRTAVCCLSSVNLEYYDEWKNNELFIADIAEMLDNVLQKFIDTAPDTIARAKYSAAQERSIGVGALGFHAYLQLRNIAFESGEALYVNENMFEHISNKLMEANLRLGKERGEAPDAVGTGRRFSHTMAIAPNASTSIIMGNTSASIEPYPNAYRQDTLSGASFNVNRSLLNVLKEKCKEYNLNIDDVITDIMSHSGSVQHLNFLDDHTKKVYKTAIEIDQRWVVEHAAVRQQYIDQGQSVNLFFAPTASIKYLHAVHFLAWKKGLKALYYCRSEKLQTADILSQQIERKIIEELSMEDLVNEEASCIACEG